MNKIELKVICERDGWDWFVEPQEDCPDGGVDLVYAEPSIETDYGSCRSESRTCLGSLEDAESLAEAIIKYVKIMRSYGQ